MNRFRLGDGEDHELNLRALFAALDLPWDEAHAKEIFQKAMAQLQQRDEQMSRPAAEEPQEARDKK